MTADKVVLNSAIVTMGSTMAASVLPESYGGQGGLPSPRLLVGGGLTFVGLSILGDIVPAVARPLSAAIAVTALMYYGIPIADNYMNGKHNPVGHAPARAEELSSLPGLTTFPPGTGKD